MTELLDLFDSAEFEPTPAAAAARLRAVRPAAYARTRNHLDGAVTRLSPYLTHGLLTLPGVLAQVLQHGALPVQHKLVYELGWREYFHHVWQHEGEGIFTSLHPGVLPDAAYAPALPVDIRTACTGVPAIDCAVRELYASGYLHNHARMWLASYVVHVRRVHWRAGADWLYGHLLDGDLASNHLSWQWVAGTGSHKPYLFNAENVARYAPPAWHSPGSVIDTDYATLDRWARQPQAVAHTPRPSATQAPTAEPPLLNSPPAGLFRAPGADAAQGVQGRHVLLVHPWSLGALPAAEMRIGVVCTDFHARWPWNAARWQFVSSRMQACCDVLWQGSASAIGQALAGAASVQGVADMHLGPAWNAALPHSRSRLLTARLARCNSFSQFWTRATKGKEQAAELLSPNGNSA